MQNLIQNNSINDTFSGIELAKKLDCNKYININEILSYKAFLNVLMGGRGLGKTTQVLIWCSMQYKKYGHQFIYVRRYKTHTKKQTKLLESIFKTKITYVGMGDGSGYWKWKGGIIAYLIPLSTASDFKSVNFDNVHTIIYDEAIIKRSSVERYLQNEMFILLELISTVFRHKIEDIRVFVMGNNLDFFNPYCQYYNITLFNKTYFDKDRSILVRYDDSSPTLKAIEEKTPLFKLTRGTEYHRYHYDNEVLKDSTVEISKKRNNDKLVMVIQINNYHLKLYTRDNGRYLLESTNKKVNHQGKIIIMENNELNFFWCDTFKSRYLKFLQYKIGIKEVDYADEDSNQLLSMLFDIF